MCACVCVCVCACVSVCVCVCVCVRALSVETEIIHQVTNFVRVHVTVTFIMEAHFKNLGAGKVAEAEL